MVRLADRGLDAVEARRDVSEERGEPGAVSFGKSAHWTALKW